MSNELYTITDFEVTCDQLAHPEMNYSQFTQYADQELKKFIQMVANLQSDFIAPQDVGAVSGINCRFHSINGYPAVRQLTQYQPNSKTWMIWFDCRVLTRAPEAVKMDGSAAAKLEPQPQQPSEPSTDPSISEADVQAEFQAKFNTVH